MNDRQQNLFQELFADNPAIKDVQRLPWQRMNPRHWSTSTVVSVAILAVAYIALTTLALQGAQWIDASLFMYICLFACGFAPAIVLYNTVAGEREKRTIDLLLVAPVTTAQIIVAKLTKILAPTVCIIVLLLVPMLMFRFVRPTLGLKPLESGTSFALAVTGTIVLSLCVALFVTGVAMWISGLNKTTAGALTGVLALLFLVYIVYPVMAGVFGPINQKLTETLLVAHPLFALSSLTGGSGSSIQTGAGVTVSCVLHAIAGLVFLVLAVRQLDRFRAKESKTNA